MDEPEMTAEEASQALAKMRAIHTQDADTPQIWTLPIFGWAWSEDA